MCATPLRRSTRRPQPRRLPSATARLFYSNHLPDELVRCRRRLVRLHTDPNIWFVERFLTQQEVEHLTACVEGARLQRSFTEADQGARVVSQQRTSTFTWLSKSQDKFVRQIEQRAAEMAGLSVGCIEPFQLVSYRRGQQFRLHHDAGTLLAASMEEDQELHEGKEVACQPHNNDDNDDDGDDDNGYDSCGVDAGDDREAEASSCEATQTSDVGASQPVGMERGDDEGGGGGMGVSPQQRRQSTGNTGTGTTTTTSSSSSSSSSDATGRTRATKGSTGSISTPPFATPDMDGDAGEQGKGATVDIQPPRRLVTFFVYLNSLPEGQGHTEFPWLEGQPSVRPEQGCAVLFPNMASDGTPDARTAHRATPVSGKHRKLGLNIWLTDTEFPPSAPSSSSSKRKGRSRAQARSGRGGGGKRGAEAKKKESNGSAGHARKKAKEKNLRNE